MMNQDSLPTQNNKTIPVWPSVMEVNRCNREFWDNHYKFFKVLLDDEVIHAGAIDIMQSEWSRQVPWTEGNEFEKALEISASAKKRALHQRAVKAGKSRKGDTLNELILKIVRTRPDITDHELYTALEHEKHNDVIIDIDQKVICFINHNGGIKDVPRSGLKHRLTRAKNLWSRNPDSEIP